MLRYRLRTSDMGERPSSRRPKRARLHYSLRPLHASISFSSCGPSALTSSVGFFVALRP